MARMGAAPGFRKPQGTERSLIVNQLDASLQLDCGQPKGNGPAAGMINQGPCQPLAAMPGRNRQLAQIQTICLWRQHHAGNGGSADGPDLGHFRLPGQIGDSQEVHRRGWVDPPVHIGKFGLDQVQDGREIGRRIKAVELRQWGSPSDRCSQGRRSAQK